MQIERNGGVGSGFVFDSEGHILTAAHVVGRASRVQAVTRAVDVAADFIGSRPAGATLDGNGGLVSVVETM